MPVDAIINVNGDSVQALDITLLLVVITLLPTLVVMMTSFTKYAISFSFLRTAMGTQQTPPNMVLVGMALILTLFTMTPTMNDIKTNAYDPYVNGAIGQEEFFDRAQIPLKRFMLRNAEISSVELFCTMAGETPPATVEELEQAVDLPITVVTAAFVTSELKAAFWIGFLVYIPFMLIDVIVSSTLMSMGMIMLPPSMISTPFKILLFIMLDGWQLLFSTLIQTVK
ncbi:MAG: flagellar type III secretion system pore protein FliP [Oscillospiraceae bacterium]|nr:flagellar type III secretion system pore protein FliP [Oscillospiraceae bacterium]